MNSFSELVDECSIEYSVKDTILDNIVQHIRTILGPDCVFPTILYFAPRTVYLLITNISTYCLIAFSF